MRLSEIDTPALLLDLDAMERNLAKMAGFFSAGSTRLRPHYKNHKCPALARRQLDAGAIGMTCATLAEAEALVANDIGNLLISSEIAGDQKIRRFVDLSRRTDVIAVVDNAHAARALAAAGREKGCRIGVLVDINVGQNRTGVAPGEHALELARQVVGAGLWLRGLMGYEGHVAHLPEGPEKESAYDLAMNPLMQTRCLLEQNGIPIEIVSTGGTGTHHLTRRFPAITEFQAGSYLVMDAEYRTTHTEFELALTILGTVISVTEGDRVIVDAGLKSISGEHGLPVIKSHSGLRFRKLNAEHGIIDILDPSVSLAPGQTVEIWPQYSDATINLHDRMYGVRNGKVEEVLQLQG
jgi:D-serine deaminase-like pyridoxal phosphate-dependent protein